MTQSTLKAFDQTLAPFHPSIRALNDPARGKGDKSNFALGCFLSFNWFGCKPVANLPPDLRVEHLRSVANGVGMIAVVEQNRNFRNVDRFGTKVV